MEEQKDSKISKLLDGRKALSVLMRYFNFLPPVLFLLIIIFGYAFLLKPKYDKIANEIEATITRKEEERTAYENYFTRLKNLKNLLKEVTAANLEKLDKMIPSGPEAEKLMVELEAIVKGRGLFLSSIDVTPDAASSVAAGSGLASPGGLPEGINKVNVHISVAGVNYDAFKKLLNDLENHIRLLDITKTTFSPSGKTADLEMTAYYLAQ